MYEYYVEKGIKAPLYKIKLSVVQIISSRI
jgi:hypothetical protein